MSWLGKILGTSPAPSSHPPLPADLNAFSPGGKERAFRGCATASGTDPTTGEMIFRAGAGASLDSQVDADRQAHASAERNLAAALGRGSSDGGTYAYVVQRRLEPVVELLAAPDGSSAGRVTINSYGALIMNADSVFFADVDTRSDDAAPEDTDANDRAAAALRGVVERTPALGFRVYRTRNGWRYLCTTREFDPASDETRALLEVLGADGKYVLLCRAQRCFRARLTPKPWRIGHRFFNVHPSQSISRKRLESYLRRAEPYASAAFTAEIGQSAAVLPELQRIVEYHDNWCRAHSGKALA